MSKQKQIQEYERKQLIDELSKMPPMVIATAYLHALNYTLYGADVTEKWLTATQQAAVLDRAYHEGYSDALEQRWIPVSERLPEKSGDYLVTTEWIGSYSGDTYRETNMAAYRRQTKEWDCTDVIAWMPKPQPYKTESEEICEP